MNERSLYYATNRNHEGADRWEPKGYGSKFSNDGIENLRFGKVTLPVSDKEISAKIKSGGGESLIPYFTAQATKSAVIRAFPEKIDADQPDLTQRKAQFGSIALFEELKAVMEKRGDVLIYIHGFNVSWTDAVGSAVALQEMLNLGSESEITVVLFTWPSDGMALPYVSYKSDRTEAAGSGFAVARGILKLRDYLISMADRTSVTQPCGRKMHLLCHSMGNYVLQNALARIADHTPRSVLPRIFDHIFLCAPDVDDNVLEPGRSMGLLHELCRNVTVYYNTGDAALHVSTNTKGNPDRLGTNGAANLSQLHNKIHQLDCSPIVSGLVEHSYYLFGPVNADIRLTMDGESFEAKRRIREKVEGERNFWRMRSTVAKVSKKRK